MQYVISSLVVGRSGRGFHSTGRNGFPVSAKRRQAGTEIAYLWLQGRKSMGKHGSCDIFVIRDFGFGWTTEIPQAASRGNRPPRPGPLAGITRRKRGVFNPS